MMAVHTSVLWMAPLFNYQFLNKDQKIFVCFGFFCSQFFILGKAVSLLGEFPFTQWRNVIIFIAPSASEASVTESKPIVPVAAQEKANCTLATHRGALHSLTPASRSRARDYSVSAGAIESAAAFPFNSPLIRSPASNWLPNFSIRNQQ